MGTWAQAPCRTHPANGGTRALKPGPGAAAGLPLAPTRDDPRRRCCELQVPANHSQPRSEIPRQGAPGESCAVFHPLNISHTGLFYKEGKLLFLMVTRAIKQILSYARESHGVGGLN